MFADRFDPAESRNPAVPRFQRPLLDQITPRSRSHSWPAGWAGPRLLKIRRCMHELWRHHAPTCLELPCSAGPSQRCCRRERSRVPSRALDHASPRRGGLAAVERSGGQPHVAGNGLFEIDTFRLERVCSQPPASAHSGILAAVGRLATAFWDGESDYLAARDLGLRPEDRGVALVDRPRSGQPPVADGVRPGWQDLVGHGGDAGSVPGGGAGQGPGARLPNAAKLCRCHGLRPKPDRHRSVPRHGSELGVRFHRASQHRAGRGPVGSAPGFGTLVQKLAASETKREIVERFLAEHPAQPILEGPSRERTLVHFVYHGAVDDLTVSGNFIRDGGAGKERLPPHDLRQQRRRRLEHVAGPDCRDPRGALSSPARNVLAERATRRRELNRLGVGRSQACCGQAPATVQVLVGGDLVTATQIGAAG